MGYRVKIGSVEIGKGQLTVAVSAGIVLLVMYIFLFGPLMKEVKAKSSAYKALSGEVCAARGLIESAGKITDERDLLTEKEVLPAIDELTKHGKSMKINFESIRPREVMQDENSGCRILPVDLAIEGNDAQMAMFMGSLDDLRKSLIIVNSFDIIPDRNDPSKLKATITINMYFLAGGSRQEK